MSCNTNRNVPITTAFASVANPACGQFFNPGNFSGEQVIYDTAFKDLINNFGVPVNYYVNTFNLSTADLLYGENPTRRFLGPVELQMYVELSENAINLSKFGFASDDDLTGYLHIDTFTSTMGSVIYYSCFNQAIEPKAGDIIELTSLGCDRPNGRGPKWFEITERVDQDIAQLNPLLGHYVYRIRAKRYEHSFEPGLSGEQQNQQIYENSFMGIVSAAPDLFVPICQDTGFWTFDYVEDSTITDFNAETSPYGNVAINWINSVPVNMPYTVVPSGSSADFTYTNLYASVSASESKSYTFDIDEESKTMVLDMSVNDTDIYGTYY